MSCSTEVRRSARPRSQAIVPLKRIQMWWPFQVTISNSMSCWVSVTDSSGGGTGLISSCDAGVKKRWVDARSLGVNSPGVTSRMR